MNRIWIVFFKEMREVLRDRRALIFMLVIPTLMIPLLFNLMISFISKQDKTERERVLKVAFRNPEQLPDLASLFNREKGFEIVPVLPAEEVPTAIRAGELDLLIEIPADAKEYLSAHYAMKLDLIHDNAVTQSKVVDRAQELISAYSEELRMERLKGLGLTSLLEQNGIIEPIQVSEVGIAGKREILGNSLGGMLPYIFILVCFLGSMMPAIDLGAGEKERGTLETLLLTPVPRHWLIWGKFLVIFASGMITALLSVTSFGIWIAFRGEEVAGELGKMIAEIGALDILLVFFMLVPLSAVFSAILLSISIYARSYKEAQSMITPFNFLVILPAFIAMLPGVELNWKWALVPITNVALAIKELVKGTMDYGMLGFIFLSTSMLATLAVLFCVKWFQSEKVLFRS